MQEIWKDVIGYEGLYQVSNLGNVKSLKRKGCLNDRILKYGCDPNGYKMISLNKNKTPKTHKIHKLVAIAFLNHIPNRHKIEVDHIDNNKKNNHVNNLQLISHRENIAKSQFNHNKTSKYVGVYWYKKLKKWRADIWINGNSKYIGIFVKELDAAKAYQEKLKEINE